MPSGSAPTVAHDLNATMEWWAGRIAGVTRQAEDAARALRATAEAYERADQGVVDRFTAGRQVADGGGPNPPAGMRAL